MLLFKILSIECRVKATKMMWDPTDSLVECSLLDAMFVCHPTPTHVCEDYEVRVLCDVCSVTTTGQPIATPSLPAHQSASTAVPYTCSSGWSEWIDR